MDNSKGKVIFVNPCLDYEGEGARSDSKVYPYPGLMILASVLAQADYNAKLIDSNIYSEEEFLRRLFLEIDDDVIFVGFGLMTVNVIWSYKIITEIKSRFPNIKIAVGGFHPTLFPDQMIEDENIDIVAINESASIIIPLTDALRTNGDLSEVNGIYYKKDGAIHRNPPNEVLDGVKEVPFINLDLIEHEEYSRNNVILFPYFPKKKEEYITYPILTSFGCPYKCTFCINAILERAYRYRSAESIVDRIEYLMKEHNANFIILQDEEFCINKKRFIRFVELVEERGLKFHWRTSLRVSNFRPDYIDDDLAQRLQNIGMVNAVMGGESGSQRILDEIKKEVSVEEIIYAMEALSKTTIVPKISFMVGMPGETDEEVQETYSLCIKLKKLFLKQNKIADIGIFPFRLYPGSPLFDKAINDLGLKPETRSLKEMCTAVDGDELKEGMGYEPIYKSYIKDPKKFEDMLFIYDYFIWLNQKRTNVIRNLFEAIAMFRIENRFYHGVFIERAMVKSAREIRNSYRRIRSKWRVFKSSFRKQPEIKPKFPTDIISELQAETSSGIISELQAETSSGTEFQEEMKRESLKRSFFGC